MNADAIAEYGRRTQPISSHWGCRGGTVAFAKLVAVPVTPGTFLEPFLPPAAGVTFTIGGRLGFTHLGRTEYSFTRR